MRTNRLSAGWNPGWLWIVALLAGTAGCSQEPAKTPPMPKDIKVEKISVPGEKSGFTLVGSLFHPKEKKEGQKPPAAILLHQMNANRGTWNSVAGMLAEAGFMVLAYDAPGHGESVAGLDGKKKGTWQDFQDDAEFWKKFYADVPAVKKALADMGADTKALAVCGASVGANEALTLCASDEDVQAAVALSPGKDYRGIETYGIAPKIVKPLFLVCSKNDGDPEAGPSINKLVKTRAEDKVFRELPGDKHGTELFETEPKLPREVADFVAARVKKAAEKK